MSDLHDSDLDDNDLEQFDEQIETTLLDDTLHHTDCECDLCNSDD